MLHGQEFLVLLFNCLFMISFKGGAIRLGILGGGQLGRMLIQKAIDYNLSTFVLDPDEHAPCKDICTAFTHGNFKNYDDVMRFIYLIKRVTWSGIFSFAVQLFIYDKF